MNSASINLVIADDHNIVIEGVKMYLKDERDICILNIASDGRELLSVLQNKTPDIVLMDINMPNIDGFKAMKEIRIKFPRVKIIVLSNYKEKYMIDEAKELGASGYLLKNCCKEDLLHGIRSVFKGETCLPVEDDSQANSFDKKDEFIRIYQLTNREIEIMVLIKKGYKTNDIAAEFNRTVDTIETHRKNIYKKLGVNSVVELINLMNKWGIGDD